MRILIVEDEVPLAEALAELLQRSMYAVDIVHNGSDGLDYAVTSIYDGIVLDIMLPVMDGLTMLQKLREKGISTPVLLLTAKSEVQDKILGLDTGADDYLTKPFVAGELMARIRAMTRRKGEMVDHVLQYGDLTLNRDTYELACEGQSVKLSAKEYQIMELLCTSPRQVIAKERFVEKIWGYDCTAEYNSVEVYMSFLRKKMALLGTGIRIKTARGLGYSLEEAQ